MVILTMLRTCSRTGFARAVERLPFRLPLEAASARHKSRLHAIGFANRSHILCRATEFMSTGAAGLFDPRRRLPCASGFGKGGLRTGSPYDVVVSEIDPFQTLHVHALNVRNVA
jgi:hypothetical protein